MKLKFLRNLIVIILLYLPIAIMFNLYKLMYFCSYSVFDTIYEMLVFNNDDLQNKQQEDNYEKD